MRKVITIFILCGFSCLLTQLLFSSLSSDEKRDPFRDLLEEKEITEKSLVAGTTQFSINDIVLTGISKARGKFKAIINGPQGFPYFIKTGDKFFDGYVLSITESQVVFCKTKEKGVPLRKPVNIVKELYPEEH